MDRLSKFLLAAALIAAPAPVLAQSKAAALAGSPQMASKTPALIVMREAAPAPRQGVTLPDNAPTPRLQLGYDAPEVSVPAKDDWFDDEGLQWKGSKVAFKRRF